MAQSAGKREESLRAVRITLWLGADQEFSIELGKTLAKRFEGGKEGRDFFRTGFASQTRNSDVLVLVPEMLGKLSTAFLSKGPITLWIDDDDEPVSSPKPQPKD